MSRPLVLTYHFPPIGGAGSQRWLKLARYLPESSPQVDTVTVLTGSGRSGDVWSPIDETLVGELPSEVDVERVPGPEPTEARRELRAERWLLLDTDWSRWWLRGAVEHGTRLAQRFDVIVASMPPYISARAAAELSRRVGKPWVADLRDPWALDEMLIYPTGFHRRADVRRMRRLLASAAAIVTTTPEAVRRVTSNFPELTDRPIVSIANGFDARDFAGPSPARTDDAFRIVHAGYLHTSLGLEQRRRGLRRWLGGEWRGADLLTRSHVYVVQAIERLVDRRPELRGTIELHLAGALSERDREVALRSPSVRLHGYLTHGAAVDLMRSADLLFLPMQKMPPGARSGIVPGKVYEYIAARRPILAAVPQGDARDILLEAGCARICEPDDVEGMASAIHAEIIRRPVEGPTSVEVSPGLLQRFERRTLAERYAQLLGALVAPTRTTAEEAEPRASR